MRILYFAEYNDGGGARSNISLANSATKYAEVAYLGIDPITCENSLITFFKSHAKNSLTIRFFLDFYCAIISFKPDIVHATGMYTGLLALLLRSFFKVNYKIIITLRHTSTEFRLNFISKKLIPLLNSADQIHYLTDYQRKLYKPFGLNPKVYNVIPNIVFLDRSKKVVVQNLREDLLQNLCVKHLIVYAGRIVRAKQIDIFIESISEIRKEGYNVGGIIMGSGDNFYLRQLKELAERRQIKPHLYFTGYVNNPELFMEAADFCLFPTQWAEALPRFIVESFRLGKTLVVSNHASISSLIKHEHDVLKVDSHTPNSYANECIRIIKDKNLKSCLEKGAINSYLKRFDPEIIGLKYKKIYQSFQIH